MKKYRINEMFYSVQGEGIRSGTANLFIRFSGCNMDCHSGHEEENADFDCDTEFVSGRSLTQEEIFEWAKKCCGGSLPPAVIFTGGEPGLQLDRDLVEAFQNNDVFCAIESNGTIDLMSLGLDWITVSPKVAEHALKAVEADEVKYVRHWGQGIPKPSIRTKHRLISPAFKGQDIDPEATQWCVQLVKENPKWRLSIQTHKWIQVQ